MAEPIPSPNKPHAVVIPYPLQGHTIPAVHLAIKLASRGFTITFVNTEAIHHRTTTSGDDDIFAGARSSGLDIRYEVFSDGLPITFDRSLHHDTFMRSLLHVAPAHVDHLLSRLLSSASPPLSCLIADTFFVWPASLSRKLGVPYVSFWTEPALVFSLYFHLDLLNHHGHFATQDNRKDTITYIPGVPAIETKDLMSYLQATDLSSVEHRIIFKAFEGAKEADYVLCNTVQELENSTISALQEKKPFYAVGPIFPAGICSVSTSLWAESDCTQWLDTRQPGSVLYVSFGSYAHVGKGDLEEIARGVLQSGVSFIWVLRPDIVSSDEAQPLPEGFEEEARGRGVVVQWCSQTEVLRHGATGGFLTHCGWNSVLESVWSGVPMLCFPLLTDQFTNRKLVVEDWKVGVDVGRVGRVSREEVKERIGRLMMGGVEGEVVRKKVRKVRRKLEAALGSDGSSERNLERFIADVSGHAREEG